MKRSVRCSPLAATAVAAMAFLPTGCIIVDWENSTHAVEATEEFSIPAAGLQSLGGRVDNGSLELTGRPDLSEVTVVVRKQALGRSQEEALGNLAKMQVNREVRGDELWLDWEWREPRSGNRSASVTFRIEAPANLAVNFTTHNGHVFVTDWRGDVRAQSHNGEMDIEGEFRDVELITHNGDVRARLEGSGTLNGHIETHNGQVEVEVGEGISAQIVASTVNGGVSSRGQLARVESGRNFLVGDIGTGEGRLRVQTHNGTVTIR